MNRKYAFLACLSWLAACTSLLAADPLVLFPKGDFYCTVAVTPRKAGTAKPDPAQKEQPSAPELKKVTITQAGNIRLDRMTWFDGSVSKIWILVDRNLSIEENRNKSIYALTPAMRDNALTKLLDFTPESVNWITPDALSNGKAGDPPPVLHYQATVQVNSALGDSSLDGSVAPVQTIILQAWIDSKTLLPLQFDNGHGLYVLTFSNKAPEPIPAMPANVQAEFKLWQAAHGPQPHL